MVALTKQTRTLSTELSSKKAVFLRRSGLDKYDMEIKQVRGKPNKLSIVYRDPITDQRMKTPDGRTFRRFRLFKPEINHKGEPVKYRTCKNGGIRLYFPSCPSRGQVRDYLKSDPNAPVYITEGEKKAAKAWKEGIPC